MKFSGHPKARLCNAEKVSIEKIKELNAMRISAYHGITPSKHVAVPFIFLQSYIDSPEP
jgi:hypothetical protein